MCFVNVLIFESSLFASTGLSTDFVDIFKGIPTEKIPPFMKLFWEEQQKYIRKSNNNIRYHPSVIKFCLAIAAKSPSAYNHSSPRRHKIIKCHKISKNKENVIKCHKFGHFVIKIIKYLYHLLSFSFFFDIL